VCFLVLSAATGRGGARSSRCDGATSIDPTAPWRSAVVFSQARTGLVEKDTAGQEGPTGVRHFSSNSRSASPPMSWAGSSLSIPMNQPASAVSRDLPGCGCPPRYLRWGPAPTRRAAVILPRGVADRLGSVSCVIPTHLSCWPATRSRHLVAKESTATCRRLATLPA